MPPNSHITRTRTTEVDYELVMGLDLENEDDIGSNPEEPFTTIAQDILPHQLDCIGWNHRHGLLTFGSYEIDPENSERRLGILYLATLCPQFPAGYEVLQTIECLPGLLDLKWEPTEETKLVLATSESVILYTLDKVTSNAGSETVLLTEINRLPTKPDMALYIQWMNPTDVIFSDSAGKINTWTMDPNKLQVDEETNELSGVTSCVIHQFFVWCVHYDPISEIVYSGDDNGLFRGFHIDHLKSPALHQKRQFETGVTSILTKDDIVAVGCYDERLRILTRSIDEVSKRVTLSLPLLEMDLKGTVWRTMWIPPLRNDTSEDANLYKVAVAAGRNGLHMITFNRSDWTWDTTLCCLDHQGDLAYGIDLKSNVEEGTYTVASCYFDSHCLHIFTMKP